MKGPERKMKGAAPAVSKKKTLDHYYQQAVCAVCRKGHSCTDEGEPPVCASCLEKVGTSLRSISLRQNSVLGKLNDINDTCRTCCSTALNSPLGLDDIENLPCVSLDCHIPFERMRTVNLNKQFDILRRFLVEVNTQRIAEGSRGQ